MIKGTILIMLVLAGTTPTWMLKTLTSNIWEAFTQKPLFENVETHGLTARNYIFIGMVVLSVFMATTTQNIAEVN